LNVHNIKPTPGNILVKKLPDEFATKSGILFPENAPANKYYIYVEVIAIGDNLSENLNIKIEVKPGDRGIAFGRGIYDTIIIDNESYYLLKQVDIPIIIMS